MRAGTEPVDEPAALTGERRYVSVVPTQLVRALDGDLAWLRGFDAGLSLDGRF